MARPRRIARTLVAVAGASGAVAVVSACAPATFCGQVGVGGSARAAAAAYVRACGTDYRVLERYRAGRGASVYAGYVQLVEYKLSVKNNAAGAIAFLLVGRRAGEARWRTLGAPGNGP
jgi:hypothetical protein